MISSIENKIVRHDIDGRTGHTSGEEYHLMSPYAERLAKELEEEKVMQEEHHSYLEDQRTGYEQFYTDIDYQVFAEELKGKQ